MFSRSRRVDGSPAHGPPGRSRQGGSAVVPPAFPEAQPRRPPSTFPRRTVRRPCHPKANIAAARLVGGREGAARQQGGGCRGRLETALGEGVDVVHVHVGVAQVLPHRDVVREAVLELAAHEGLRAVEARERRVADEGARRDPAIGGPDDRPLVGQEVERLGEVPLVLAEEGQGRGAVRPIAVQSRDVITTPRVRAELQEAQASSDGLGVRSRPPSAIPVILHRRRLVPRKRGRRARRCSCAPRTGRSR